MKIRVDRVAGGPCTLEEFADRHGLTMVVSERPLPLVESMGLRRYYARFEPMVEVSDRGMLACIHGNGNSPEEAIADFAHRLRGEKLVIGAYTAARREVQAPNEWVKR